LLAGRLDFSRWTLPLLFAGGALLVGILAGYQPKLAIGVSIGLAFILVAFADLTLGLVFFIAMSTIDFASSATGALSVTKLVGLLLAASWLAVVTTRSGAREDFLRAHPYISVGVGMFLGWSLLSFAWAENAGFALGSSGRWALDFILILIVFTAVQNRSQAILVGYAFLAGAVFAAAYGLVFPPVTPYEGRLDVGTLDPNQLAAILVAGVAVGLGLAAAERRRPLARANATAAVAFCVVAVLLTASRGGLIALAVTMLATLVLIRHWRVPAAIAAILIAFAGYYYYASIATQQQRDRLLTTTQGEQQTQEGRTTIWHVGWRTFEANPILGVGDGNFGVSSRHYLLEPGAVGSSDKILRETPAAHNAYLQVAAELGIVGEVLFLGVVTACIGSALMAARDFERAGDRGMALYASALAVSIIGYLAAAFFISEQQSKQRWLLLGLAPALRSIAMAGAPAPAD
jgi:putative inorganic carbon (HCO3(-)) transporter